MLDGLKKLRANRKQKKLEKAKTKYQNWLRSRGAKIGNNVSLYPETSTVDSQTPFLLEIGDNVCFSKNVTILNHDYSNCVVRRQYGQVHGSIGPVKIGNNVFIGINATILHSVTIGDNCIIGANSVVNKDVPSGEVWAGNPARKICTTKDMMEKWEQRQVQEATIIAKEYYKKYGQKPPRELWLTMHYFVMWTPVEEYPESFNNDFGEINNPTLYEFMKNKPLKFKSYEEFLNTIDF